MEIEDESFLDTEVECGVGAQGLCGGEDGPEPTSSVDAEAGPSASKRGEAEGVFGRRDEDEEACSEDKVARE
jgi:hypothetical protein